MGDSTRNPVGPKPPSELPRGVRQVVAARARDLGDVTVRRVLPSPECRAVGPFVFFDHVGPVTFEPNMGVDVRPHPHIGLATVTYLFDGSLVHRDSLGCHQTIRPGDINWMTAGRGIVHSERTDADVRLGPSSLHGLQAWVALPQQHEEAEPAFHHHPGDSLPELRFGSARVRVLVGSAYGATSPVRSLAPVFYLEAVLPAGAAALELPTEPTERAVYVVEGQLEIGDRPIGLGSLHVLTPGAAVQVRAAAAARFVVLGGEPLDAPRHVWWNFVSSSRERIEAAKQEWRERRFPAVPGDDQEFIPLPD